MLHDTSNTNSTDGASIETTPQNQGDQPQPADMHQARAAYVVAYLRSLSDELRDAVETVIDHINGKLASPDTLAGRPADVWREAARVVLYTKDIYAGVYDRTADDFMPAEGHNAPRYLEAPAGGQIPQPVNLTPDQDAEAAHGPTMAAMLHQAYIGAYLRTLDADLRDKVKALIGTVDAGGSVSRALETIGLEPVQVLAYLIDVNAGTYDRTNHPIEGHKSARYMLR
jgi:hypothetical protein